MIALIPKVSLTEAKYTKLLNDIGEDTYDEIHDLFQAFDETEGLIDMFYSMYRYYEICDIDETVFLQCITDVYKEYHDYYLELKTNYDKEYDYSTGNKRIVQRQDSSSSESSRSAEGTSNNTNREYDLPNKVVDPNTEDGYLTGKTTDNGGNTLDESKTASAELDSSVTTIFADEFLDLKRKYLNQIRNVYKEFVDKFKVCFLHIY